MLKIRRRSANNTGDVGRSMRGRADTSLLSGHLLCVLLGCVLPAVPKSVLASCKLLQIAAWHVDLTDQQPTISGRINGKPVRILIDTGSYRTALLGKDAQQLGLPLRQYVDRRGYAVGGRIPELTTLVHELSIGSLNLTDMTLYVLDMKEPRPFAMLLGADFFSPYDTEFDLAHGVVRLFRPVECQPQQLAYWSYGYFLARLRVPSPSDERFEMQVQLNGKRTAAVLDSGAAASLVSKAAAESAGVRPGSDTRPSEITRGLAGSEPTWEGRFDLLAVGNETIRHARLQVGELFENATEMHTGSMLPQKVEGLEDMLLGVDFLLAHHVVILPHEHQMLFTYNGGPIFGSTALDATQSQGRTGSNPEPAEAPTPH